MKHVTHSIEIILNDKRCLIFEIFSRKFHRRPRRYTRIDPGNERSFSSLQRNREQDDDEEVVAVVPKSETKTPSKTTVKPIERTVTLRQNKTEATPQKKQRTQAMDPVDRRKRAESFQSFMNRGGPDAPGSKAIPDGETNCLKNLTFVLSGESVVLHSVDLIVRFIVVLGVLESLERDECKTLIEKYGGRVTMAISGKTNFLLAGRDVSESKMAKANELKLKVIAEDDLLEMIRTRPGDDARPTKQPVTKADLVTAKPKVKTTSESTATVVSKPTVDQSGLLCKLQRRRATPHFLRASS